MNETGLVICVGELLIDFFCTDINVNLIEGTNFVKQAGGAPANVSAAVAKLGGKVSFLGKVGNDPFGHFLIRTLDEVNVDTSMILKDPLTPTTMAFVSLQSDGERDFVFNRGADELLELTEVDLERFYQAKIVHFGSATAMLGGSSLETYFTLMNHAKDKGIFVSFDPNYRSALWQDRNQEFIEWAKKGIASADFVKVSEEEMRMISGQSELSDGVKLFHEWGAKMVAVTLGKNGTFYSDGSRHAQIPSVAVKSIDSTGAGDAFVGAVLFQAAQEAVPQVLARDFDRMKAMVGFANKVGALVCTKLGGISSLPTYEEALGR